MFAIGYSINRNNDTEEPVESEEPRDAEQIHPDEQGRSAVAADGDESIYRFAKDS